MNSIPLTRRLGPGTMLGAAAWAGRPRDARSRAVALGGRPFDGGFIQRGRSSSGDADTSSCAGVRFRSCESDRCGDDDAPHRASVRQGDAVVFEAETETETEGPRHGRLIWRGTLRADKLGATALMQRSDGKASVENRVAAAASR